MSARKRKNKKVQALTGRDDDEEPQAIKLSDVIGDGEFGDWTPDMDRKMATLVTQDGLHDPTPKTAPMSQWKPEQRLRFDEAIKQLGADIAAHKIVQPASAAERRAARRHAARTNDSSALSKMAQREKARVMFDSSTADFQHSHTPSFTLPIDVRFVRTAGDKKNAHFLHEPFRQIVRSSNPHVPYLTLSRNMRTAVAQTNSHDEMVRFARSMSSGRGARKLGDILEEAAEDFGLPVHGIIFRHDFTLEVMFQLDLDGRFFAIACFDYATQRGAAAHGKELHDRTLAELTSEENKPMDAPPPPTIGSAAMIHHIALTEAALATKAGQEMIDDEFISFSGVARVDSSAGRLMARCVAMMVFNPARAKILLKQQVVFAYNYFTVCQCEMRKDELHTLKMMYGHEARRRLAVATEADKTAARSTSNRDKALPLPQFDSDDEEKESARRTRKGMSSKPVVSAETRDARAADRYRPSRAPNTAASALAMGQYMMRSTVPQQLNPKK